MQEKKPSPKDFFKRFTKKSPPKTAKHTAKGPNQRMRQRAAVLIIVILVIGFGATLLRLGLLTVVQGSDLQALLWTDRALQCHLQALDAMDRVRGRFAHIYRNDCFAGVSVTVRVLKAVRAWLRIRGDGEYLFRWEKQYLVPRAEALLSLQSHRTVQLSDEELCLRLRGEIPLAPAF